MPLILELEAFLLKKNKRNSDLVRATGHTPANISKFRNGKIKSMRMDTLQSICLELDCQPGDLIKMVTDDELTELRDIRAQAAAERLRAGLDSPIAPERVYVINTDA